MNPQRTWAVARKETLHIVRDPRSVAMAIAIPMLMLVLFGYALTLDVDRVPLVAWDQDRSAESAEFINRFGGSRYFALRGDVRDYQELARALDTRAAIIGLVIPSDFTRMLATGRTAQVQVVVDGSDSNTATIAIEYVGAVAQEFSRGIAMRVAQRSVGMAASAPVEVRPRIWYNAEMQSRNYIIPGLVAVIMMVIAALLTSLTVAREWERGTMEQLVSTPVLGSEIVTGKLLPYFALGLFDVGLAVLMGHYVFHVPLRGSVALVFGCAAVFLVGALSMGMLISIATRNQLLASQLAMVLTFLPSFLLSGFMYPIGNMPRAIQFVTYLVPARYFVKLLKGIYLKGLGLEILWPEAVLLVVFGVAMVSLANLTFTRKLG
jgi:ABC-2 type transport system permease protein